MHSWFSHSARSIARNSLCSFQKRTEKFYVSEFRLHFFLHLFYSLCFVSRSADKNTIETRRCKKSGVLSRSKRGRELKNEKKSNQFIVSCCRRAKYKKSEYKNWKLIEVEEEEVESLADDLAAVSITLQTFASAMFTRLTFMQLLFWRSEPNALLSA